MKTLLAKLMIWVLVHDFGEECETKDWEDFNDDLQHRLGADSRCPTCEAHEVISWLKQHYANPR